MAEKPTAAAKAKTVEKPISVQIQEYIQKSVTCHLHHTLPITESTWRVTSVSVTLTGTQTTNSNIATSLYQSPS